MATKVQGFRGHANDAENIICIVCPGLGCGFRQGVEAPGPFQCRCGQRLDVVAHEGWKAKETTPVQE